MISIDNIYNYLKIRAFSEGENFELDLEYVEELFNDGIREFFGVKVNDEGEMIEDTIQPQFFSNWRKK